MLKRYVFLGRKTPDLRCALWLHLLHSTKSFLLPSPPKKQTGQHINAFWTYKHYLFYPSWLNVTSGKKCMFLMLFLYSKIHLVQSILISTKNCPGHRDMWEFVLKGNIGKEPIKDFPCKKMDQISSQKNPIRQIFKNKFQCIVKNMEGFCYCFHFHVSSM